VAHALPLTYGVSAFQIALGTGTPARAALDLLVLLAFTGVFFIAATRVLARQMA
jgi:uncharacterized phage infection (PIP) family protein YhgE